jgi:hypothetical protein
MSTDEHCARLTRRLKAAGLERSAVFHAPSDGYYVARREATSQYSAYGTGTPFVANHLTLAQVEAFVGGMFIARRAGL